MIYWGIRAFFGFFFRLLYGLDIKAIEKVPIEGRLIVVANHVNLWDPVVVGVVMPRKIHFMAKEELFRYPIFSWVISKMAAFPVKRGAADRHAIRCARELLESGQIVAIFPEGTRQHGGQLGEAQSGAAFLAAKFQTPVLPIAIIGTDNLKPFRTRIQAIFGDPISMPTEFKANKEDLQQFSNRLMSAISELRGRA